MIDLDRLKINLHSINSYIKDIHYGGCGIFAYWLGYYLTEYKIRNFKYIAYARHEGIQEDIQKIKEHIEKSSTLNELNDVHKTFFPHVVIEIKKEHFDNHGKAFFKNLSCDQIYYVELTGEELKKFIDCEVGWNCLFDRKDIPRLKTLIKEAVQKSIKNNKE
jgi:hypothetical protein